MIDTPARRREIIEILYFADDYVKIRNERGRKAACTLQKIFWTWIISRNFLTMIAAAFVCRSPARAIALCAWIAATSSICEIP